MRISARTDYACKAILELSLHWPSTEPLTIHRISEKQAISLKYLSQILIELKSVRLVASSRGKQGGYILARSPSKITLGEVIRQIGGSILESVDSATKKKSIFAAIWKEAEEAVAGILDKITFEDIAKKAKAMEKAIVYQI